MHDVAECAVGCPARVRRRAQRLAGEGRSRVRFGNLLLVSLAFAGAVALSGCSGWGAAARSVADRMLPNPQVTRYAPIPATDAFTETYADATGAGVNYVYLVDAADGKGATREVQLIFFGAPATGAGWLEIDAKGGTGVHYRPIDEADVPNAARRAFAATKSGPV